MRADVLTSFLTDKVKVFPTQRNIDPFVLPKKAIRRAYPFLLASAMVFTTGCRAGNLSHPADNTGDNHHQTTMTATSLNEIYKEVVNTYHLTALQEKEPFSIEEINQMMAEKKAPLLKDNNFNHCPENVANFWEIVKNGIVVTQELMNSDMLSEAQKSEYRITAFKMLSQMSKIKGTKDEVDLSDYNNLKTFLYFEKVLMYRDNYNNVLGHEAGCSDERDEFLGRYYKDFENLVQKAEKYPGIEMFAKAYYLNQDRHILSSEDSIQANAISREMFNEWLKSENISRHDLLCFAMMNNDDEYINTSRFLYKRGDLFFAAIFVDPKGQLKYGDYAPVGETAEHEMRHLMQFKPTSNEKPSDNKLSDEEAAKLPADKFSSTLLAELGPSLHSLVRQDQIYKKMHHLKEDQVVDYGVVVNTGAAKLKLGELAVWFGKMEKKYPYSSIDKVLVQPEVLKQLNQWGGGERSSNKRVWNFER